jgi:putative endonuclease
MGERAETRDLRSRIGRVGEDLACHHLELRGMTVLERNARTPRGEIDVIARDRQALVFVEVKTRTISARATTDGRFAGAQPPDPFEALGPRKRARVRRVAGEWLAGQPARERPHLRELRFDAIGVLLDPRGRLVALDHREAAW